MNDFKKAIKTIRGRIKKHPLWLTHVITYACNANCSMCARRQKDNDASQELSKDENFALIDNAVKAGIVSYTMYGGEPLLYNHAPAVLKYAKDKNLYVVINTNGFFLKDRINEFSPFTNSVIVSIDAVGELHNQMRQLPGLYERAVEGIIATKGKTKVSINSVITKENKNSVPDLIKLSDDLKVPVFVQTMVHVPGYNDDLRLSEEEQREVYEQLLVYKQSGSRLLNSASYFKNLIEQKPAKCHAPKVYIRIEGDGTICYCNSATWGNIRDTNLSEVFKSDSFIKHCKALETCNKCVSACTDISRLYNNPFYAFKIGAEFLKYQR